MSECGCGGNCGCGGCGTPKAADKYSLAETLRAYADMIDGQTLVGTPTEIITRYNPITGVSEKGFQQRELGKFYTLFIQWEIE